MGFFSLYLGRRVSGDGAGVQRVKSGVLGLKSHGVELPATALRLN